MASARPPFPIVNLASAFLSGPWTARSLLTRGKEVWPNTGQWMRLTVRAVASAFPAPPALDELVRFLSQEPTSAGQWRFESMGRCYFLAAAMAPRGAAASAWQVPALTSAGQLAGWLGVPPAQLDWLADVRGFTVKQASAKLRHYVCHWRPRRRGRFRLIESPKPTLKRIQRRIVHDILDRIPPHQAAHGFRAGRSILSYATPHAGRQIVLRFDLTDFFASVHAGRGHAVFRTAGYPDEVARLLTGLCTTTIPDDVWEQRPDPRAADESFGARLRCRHLPQGAPTSPALANLCARRLDARLAGLAKACEAQYTRYADDLAFSGGELLARGARRFQVAVAVIAAEEGFALHFQKSRFMRRGVCQQLAGVVVNERVNVRRKVYDELKAILTNCIRHGPATQNRANVAEFRGHLLGRIAFVGQVNPERGAKLRRLFETILW
ncbi:MAG: reverse transcriptase family protein [Gemmataceae bacterium]|nr:reverse transcriptase family protein [Gemmataceae bacterium]